MAGRQGRRRFGAIRRLPSGRYQVRYRTADGRHVTAPTTFWAAGWPRRWGQTPPHLAPPPVGLRELSRPAT